jgi:hypothetical protein
MILQTDVDNDTARTLQKAGLKLGDTATRLLDMVASGIERPGSWERDWVLLALGEQCLAGSSKLKKPVESLVRCPACATPNFTLRGLRAHRCAARLGLQLTQAEVSAAVAQAKGGAQ